MGLVLLPCTSFGAALASSLRNGDDLMEWSSGGRFLESPALVKNDAGEVIGRGFTEAVGWDRTQLADTVGGTGSTRHIPDRECYFPLPTDCAPGA